MKVIPKIQSGGGMPPLTYYTPLTPPTSGTTQNETSREKNTSSDQENTKGEITNKDYLESLKQIDGLPNDMNELMTSVGKYYQIRNLFSNGKIDTSTLSSRYISTMNKIKIANFNKSQYDSAQTKVTNQGGLNEIAITSTGKVIVQDDKGQLRQLTSQEYLNNQDKYQALTNSNLLYLRAHSPEFSFKNEILGVVENGIGISAITKMIQDSIVNLGANEVSKEGYTYKKEGQIIKGLEILRGASERGVNISDMSIDGMYKNKLITRDQYQQASQAIQYIYNTLPSNAHTLLEVRSGNTENPKKGALDLITKLVMSRTGTTTNLGIDFQEDLNEDGSSKTQKSSQSEVKSNPLLNIVEGKGGEDSSIELNTGTSVKMSAKGINYNPPSIKDNLPITETSLENLLVNSGLMGIMSQNGAVTFGDQVIDPSEFKNIVYRGKGMTRVILPTRYVDGKYIPDFTIMDEYLEAQKEIYKIPKNLPKEEQERQQGEILYKHGLLELLDPSTGLPNLDRFRVFIATDAYGSDKDDVIKDTSLVEEVDSDNKIYQNIGKILSTKDNPYELDTFNAFNPLDYFGVDKIYSGVVYIPINNNKLQSITAYGDQIDESTATQLETDYQQFLKKQSMKSTSASAL